MQAINTTEDSSLVKAFYMDNLDSTSLLAPSLLRDTFFLAICTKLPNSIAMGRNSVMQRLKKQVKIKQGYK